MSIISSIYFFLFVWCRTNKLGIFTQRRVGKKKQILHRDCVSHVISACDHHRLTCLIILFIFSQMMQYEREEAKSRRYNGCKIEHNFIDFFLPP